MERNKQRKGFEMRNEDCRLSGVYKIIIFLTFVISIVILSILIIPKMPKYTYRTEIISLDNSNAIVNGKMVDYVCDEGVYVYKFFGEDKTYFSTWEFDYDVKEEYKGTKANCMIKIKDKSIRRDK